MAGANFILDKGFKVAAAATKFQIVKYGSADDTVTPVTAVTDAAIGVLQEDCPAADVAAGRVCNVRMHGISTCVAGGPITRGTKVRATTTGAVQALAGTAGTNEVVVGIAMESAVSGDWVHVDLTLGAASNTAVS
jgi:hypothetical protein